MGFVKAVEVADVYSENTYFYIDENTKHGFLIDPGAEADRLIHIIGQNDWDIERILITHGHIDHIGAVRELHDRLGIPYYIFSPEGELYLTNPQLNLSYQNRRYIVLDESLPLHDSDLITSKWAPGLSLKVIHTPGHTPDSVIYYSGNDRLAFVGDLIYFGGVGLTNFPGGNMRDEQNSLVNKLLRLPSDTVLYSGHMPPISVAQEKQLL